MTTYKVIRFFFKNRASEVVKRGLTLEEAQEHCSDPEASSGSATTMTARHRTLEFGDWFDGYDEE